MKTLVATLIVFVCVLLLVPLGPRPSAKNRGDGSDKSNLNPGTQSSQCLTCPEVAEQTIYAPLISLPESTGTEINLNCRSAHTMEVAATFFTRKGQAVGGTTFVMQAAEVKTVDLKTLMPADLRNRRDLGGMSLSYTGRPLEMWGQLRLLRAQNGSSVDVVFVYLPDRRSTVRNSVWSTSSNDTAVIAIGNPRNTPTKAVLQFANGDTDEIEVPAFGTEIIRRRSPQRGAVPADGLTITSADGSVDLIAAGAVLSPGRGFRSSIRFYDTEVVAQQNLFATNVRLQNVNSTLVLRNVSNADVIATPRIRPVSGDSNNFVDLAAVTVRSGEIQTIDLTPFALTTHGVPEFKNVSIEILNTGSKGSLVGALNGTDQITGLTYDVPLRDSGRTRTSTGAYPWRIDGDFSTIASITNVSALPTHFIVQIKYAGGTYMLDPQTLTGGATATFDLRKIRDEQIPDRDGNTIPLSVEGGQFRWSVFGPGIGRLIGRAEMLSESSGISSSYSCGTTCPPAYDRGWLEEDPTEMSEGSGAAIDAFQMNVDSFSNEYGPYAANVQSWSSSDEDVAIVGFGMLSAGEAGSATITATVQFPLYWYDNQTFDCFENGTDEDNVQGGVQVNPSVSVTNVTWSPSTTGRPSSVTLTVSISASTGVPANTSVGVEAFLWTNPNSVNVSTSGQSQKSTTISGGQVRNVVFDVSIANGNTGAITYKGRITSATSNPAMTIEIFPAGNEGAVSGTLTVQ